MAAGMNTGIGAGIAGGTGEAGITAGDMTTGTVGGTAGRATTDTTSVFDIPSGTVTPPESITQPRQGEIRRDDLREIEGIGPAISKQLHDAGIHTFQQLAETDPARLSEILGDERLRNITNTESWPEQARLADAGDWEGLRALKERLKGGRQS
jgi:predicted flap endonuclease-1-like 5' DNA nuclease